MQSMARLQPEIKKLQERYKNDKERLNQEMMTFYRENKVNPFASCLPMVAQLPVFLSLYYMLRTDLRTTSARTSTRPARRTRCRAATAATRSSSSSRT
jgi:YidC/Oxa1 family membrane protein insertase